MLWSCCLPSAEPPAPSVQGRALTAAITCACAAWGGLLLLSEGKELTGAGAGTTERRKGRRHVGRSEEASPQELPAWQEMAAVVSPQVTSSSPEPSLTDSGHTLTH